MRTSNILTWKTNVSLCICINLYAPVASETQWSPGLSAHFPAFHKVFNVFFFCSRPVSGVGKAEEAEMKLMASTPHRSHVLSVASFDQIKSVQKKFISQVCAGVDDQLSSLASGEEGEMWRKLHFYLFFFFFFM